MINLKKMTKHLSAASSQEHQTRMREKRFRRRACA
jgi:hypothetical protein